MKTVHEQSSDRPTPVTSLIDLPPMHANVRDFWLGWGARKRLTAPTALYVSGVAHPLFNGVLRGTESDSWERVGPEFDGVPWLWWVGADSPPRLEDALLAQGAVEVETMPVMTVEIARVPAVEPPPGLVLGEVHGDDEIDRWVRMLTPNSDLPAEIAPDVSRVERAKPAPSDGEYVRLAGRLDGEIVASAILLTSHGIAGIYAVSTEASHRRRGIGRAITAAALDAAAARGLRVAVLHATPDGEPLYERMGFRTVSHYRLLAPAGS